MRFKKDFKRELNSNCRFNFRKKQQKQNMRHKEPLTNINPFYKLQHSKIQ